MKKIKNKFIFIILSLIVLVLWLQVYSSSNHIDTNSYALLISWTWYIDNDLLKFKKRQIINVWSTIKTVWEDSVVVIEWWDNSITRLWWNSEVNIVENYVSSDLTKLQFSFKLVTWKTWTHLVSIFGKDSYFKQYIDDVEAWVRWTVFEVNKEKDYIIVQDHEVTLKNLKNQNEIIVWEKKPVSIKTFSFIELQQYLNNLKNNAWEELNKKLDKELILKLQSSINKLHSNNPINSIIGLFSDKQDILNSLKNWDNIDEIKLKISKLNESEKVKIFNEIFTKYQGLNFLSVNDENYDKKLYYKEALLQSSTNAENTSSLVKNTLYDINDIIESNNLMKLTDSVKVLANHKELVKELNIDFNKYVNLSLVPDWLKESMINSLTPLKDILNINLDLSSLKSLDWAVKWKINEFLDENVGWLIDSIKNLKK